MGQVNHTLTEVSLTLLLSVVLILIAIIGYDKAKKEAFIKKLLVMAILLDIGRHILVARELSDTWVVAFTYTGNFFILLAILMLNNAKRW